MLAFLPMCFAHLLFFAPPPPAGPFPGDPRGAVVCRCEAHGKKQCPCMEGVVAIEALVKSFGARVVTVCQEWSGPRRIKLEHLQLAMPGEVRSQYYAKGGCMYRPRCAPCRIPGERAMVLRPKAANDILRGFRLCAVLVL